MSSIKVYLPKTESVLTKPITTLNELYQLGLTVNKSADEKTVKELKENDFYFSKNDKAPFVNSTNTELALPVLVDEGVKLYGTVPIVQYLANKFEILDSRPSKTNPKDPSGAVKRAVAQAALDLYSSRIVNTEGSAIRQDSVIESDFDKLFDTAASIVEGEKLSLIGGDDLTVADLLLKANGFKTSKYPLTTPLSDLKKSADTIAEAKNKKK